MSDTEQSSDYFDVFPMDYFFDAVGNSLQAKYIKAYLSSSDINAKTLIIEYNYIDRDYLIDYSNYYSRSFEYIDKFTKRIHFFSHLFDETNFKNALFNKDSSEYNLIFGSYVGFLILKPIKRSFAADPKIKEDLIGRTVLKTYNCSLPDTGDTRCFIKTKNKLNLYGKEISIESLPFQTQDIAVGACATTSLWVVNHLYNEIFDITKMSLYEITKKSNEYTEGYRNFPSGGLTLKQVLTFLKSIGLDYEIININSLFKNGEHELLKEIIPIAVKSYILHAKIPIIVFLKDLGSESDYDKYKQSYYNTKEVLNGKDSHSDVDEWEEQHIYHTAVISGFRSSEDGVINELYVHDDGLGPYTRVKSMDEDNSFVHWKRTFMGIDSVYEVMYLVVPIYPKVRLSFGKISEYFDIYLDEFRKNLLSGVNPQDYTGFFYLTTVQKYKTEILSNLKSDEQLRFLGKSMPRFIWIFRFKYKDNLVRDVIYDGTSVVISEIASISYI